jgi:UbiD family decarboxylase
MPFESFRDFLACLESEGELKRVTKEVDPYLETTLVAKKSMEEGGPGLYFENVKENPYPRKEKIPLTVAVYGSRKRVFMSVDMDERNWLRDYMERITKERMAQYAAKTIKEGPCKENIIKGDDVDLFKFPITWHAPRDRGWYIDATVCIVQHPDTRCRNASVHRLLLHEKNQTGLWMAPADLEHIIMLYWERNEPCPMAVAIGADPAVMMAASTRMPFDWDEFAIAGALRDKPVEMVPCETLPIDVPATAEIIIEGWLQPHKRKPEGPFVEFTGYYGDERLAPVWDVCAITHRNNPIYNDIVTGPPPDENQPMTQVFAVEIFNVVSQVFPVEDILDVFMTEGGCQVFNAVVKIKKRYPGQGKQVAAAALTCRATNNVWVVDDDIDARDHVQVEWACATRCRAEDIFHIPGSICTPLSPLTPGAVLTKTGYDCTTPIGDDKRTSPMIHFPCRYPTHTVNLEDYIGPYEKRR